MTFISQTGKISLVMAIVLLGAGCRPSWLGGTVPTATTPSAVTLAGDPVDWSNLSRPVALSNGMTAHNCGGDAPLLCLYQGTAPIGQMELLTYDITVGDQQTLSERAADYHRNISADRRASCPAAYSVSIKPTRDTTVAGLPGIMLGLEVRDAGGKPVERYTLYMAKRGLKLYVFNVSGYEEGACVGGDVSYTTIASLDQGGQQAFAVLVKTSRLPSP